MAGRIVTVARFDQAGQAHIAKNVLESAGIKVAIADETVVSMDWFLSNAVGGIKVQVLEEDAERAVAVLEEALGSDDPNEQVDEEAMAAEAEAAGTEDAGPPSGVFPSVATMVEPAAPDSSGAGPSERDEYARRFVLAALFGLVVPLLWFYAIYLFLNMVFGEGPLSARGRSRMWLGVLPLIFGAVVAMYFIWLYKDPFP